MTHLQKIGIVAGVIGTFLGCTAWMFLLGFALGEPVLIIAPIATGALCGGVGLWLFKVRPRRYLGICGLAGLWLVMLNGILANAYFDRIPETLGGMSTGKTGWALFQVNFFVVALGLFASFGIVREFLKEDKKG
jgi:hypothetical protein